jgi:DNA-directed RNA polymerase specialized sigma24 family protein
LTSKAGEIIRLYYVEGRNLNEISQELKLSLPAIKSRKAKALKLLRKQLPYLRYLIMLKIFL